MELGTSMVGPFGEYIDILVRNNSLPKALLPVVELSRKLCWVVRNPCEKERGLEKGGLVETSTHALPTPRW